MTEDDGARCAGCNRWRPDEDLTQCETLADEPEGGLESRQGCGETFCEVCYEGHDCARYRAPEAT